MPTQLAVRLSDEQLELLDWYVIRIRAASRADAFRIALETAVREVKRREIDEAYIRGYAEVPESAEELAETRRQTIESIEEEPWAKWW